MPPPFDASRIVFDLDGTLVDTAPDLCAAMNHVLAGIDRPPLALPLVRHLVGQGARRLLERGLAESGGLNADDPDFEMLLPRFLDHYRANIATASRPFAGALDLLDDLKARRIPMGLCTNKPQGLTEALLDALGLAHYFPVVIGGDALPARKPDPVHLDGVLAGLGTGPALLIGDTVTDLKAARASRIPVLIARFGYSPEPVDSLGADAVFDSFFELSTLLRLAPGKEFG